MTRSLRLAIVTLAVLAAARVAAAQTPAVIHGRVSDSQDQPRAGVVLTVSGEAGTGGTRTGADGRYSLTALSPGQYDLRAEAPGLGPATVFGLWLDAGDVVKVSLVLLERPGEPAPPPVIVRAAPPDLRLDRDRLSRLPIDPDRQPASAAALSAAGAGGSFYGGLEHRSTAWLLDGLDLRDPEGGAALLPAPWYAPAAIAVHGATPDAGATGALVGMRSGAAGRASLVEASGAGGWSATHDAEAAGLNQLLRNADRLQGRLLASGFGAAPVGTHLHLFGAGQVLRVEQEPAGPRTESASTTLLGFLKVSGGSPGATRLLGSLLAGRPSQTGLPALEPLLTQDETSHRRRTPLAAWQGQWQSPAGAWTMDARATGAWIDDRRDPVAGRPGRFDTATGGFSGSAGYFTRTGRRRALFGAAAGRLFALRGTQVVRVSVEHERIATRDVYGLTGGVFFEDFAGQPFLAYAEGFDLDARLHRTAVAADNLWQTGPVTLRYGARVETARGRPHRGDARYETTAFSPHASVAWSAGPEATFHASAARLHESPLTAQWQDAVPGIEPSLTFAATPAGLVEIVRDDPPAPAAIDSRLERPHVDDWRAGVDLRRYGFSFRGAVVGRRFGNGIASVYDAARWTPVALPNPLGGTLTAYRWTNRAVSDQARLVTNPGGFTYRDASGAVLGTARDRRTMVMVLAGASRWSAAPVGGEVHYAWSRVTGSADTADDPVVRGRFASASTALIFDDGRAATDARHVVTAFGTIRLPWRLAADAVFTAAGGRRYAARLALPASLVNVPDPAGRLVRLEPGGARGAPAIRRLNLRLSRGFGRWTIYVDGYNVLNGDAPVAVAADFAGTPLAGADAAVPLGGALVLQRPREWMAGVRWTY